MDDAQLEKLTAAIDDLSTLDKLLMAAELVAQETAIPTAIQVVKRALHELEAQEARRG